MRSINKVFVIGNLTRDPHKRSTQGGETVVTFGVATNREWLSGESRQNATEFHEVVAWAKLAEICATYLKKGSLVFVEGYVKTRKWESEDKQQKKFKTEVVAQNVINLDRKGSDEQLAVAEYKPSTADHSISNASSTEHRTENSSPKSSSLPDNNHHTAKDFMDIDSDLGL